MTGVLRNDENYPDGSRAAALNYCRNPNTYPALWCYTTDPDTQWDYCDVPQSQHIHGTLVLHNGSRYAVGLLRRSAIPTRTRHSGATQRIQIRSGITATFRNPNTYPALWCYTTDPDTQWDYCDVPQSQHVPGTLVLHDGSRYAVGLLRRSVLSW